MDLKIGELYTQEEVATACGVSRQLLNRHINMMNRGVFKRAKYNEKPTLNKKRKWDGILRGKLWYEGKPVEVQVIRLSKTQHRKRWLCRVTKIG